MRNHAGGDSVHPVYIRDLEHANKMLAEIARLKRNIAAIEADMNHSIDRIKQAAETFSVPRRGRIRALVNGLRVFAEERKSTLFADRRALAVPFGLLGFRRSMEIKPQSPGEWDCVLEELESLGLLDGIRMRLAMDKSRLRGWDDARLAGKGAKRVETECFWYELKSENLSGNEPAIIEEAMAQ